MQGIKEDWNSTAEAYERFNSAPDSYSYTIEWPCIKALLPDIKGRDVLDIGCGTGIFTFLLEQYGPAKLIGLDLSEEMLKLARGKAFKRESKASFVQGDAARLSDYPDTPVDFIFSSTTTHYIENLSGFFSGISKTLKSGGSCIISMIHPVYSAQYPIAHGDRFPTEDEWSIRYQDMRKRAYIQPWIEYNDAYENRLSCSYHYMFSDYINAIIQAGLTITRVCEPMPPEAWKETEPYRYESFIETPAYMIIKATKQ